MTLDLNTHPCEAPASLAHRGGDPIEDALATFHARFIGGAPTLARARDALDAVRTWLAAAEHEVAAELSDLVVTDAGDLALTLSRVREQSVECFGCRWPTWTHAGVCDVCIEQVRRDGETADQAAGRVRHLDLTPDEAARLAKAAA